MFKCQELKATRDSRFLKGHLNYHSKFIILSFEFTSIRANRI
ncbi:hypothetical protein LEP1GSC108_0933 [Leptospira weilii str. UI 13098]|uniref:Uncharacterized protein n=1 Tax=Leptospira weilii str. UI 13098 TaxID=1088542 RepID=M6PY41_9LEPT|nr:hypothetical protein LEP1GSC108_0933 [Leptospira weilii str. UI 13098]